MILLTFAHRGEAQFFIKSDGYNQVEFNLSKLYKNDKDFLLITGEGLQSTDEKMIAFLSQPNINIDKVVNLGIAGALDEELELESVHLIDRILKENEIKIFQSASKKSNIDCISTFNRVQTEDYKNRLSSKAQIVDRELWAIANICNETNLPIISIKLISDYAGRLTDTQRIVQKAKEYSKKLYEYYSNQL